MQIFSDNIEEKYFRALIVIIRGLAVASGSRVSMEITANLQ